MEEDQDLCVCVCLARGRKPDTARQLEIDINDNQTRQWVELVSIPFSALDIILSV